jgi:hypothetical protein
MKGKSVLWKGVLVSRSDATPLLLNAGDTCLIERGYPRLIIMRCPCLCGEDIVVNVDPRAGKAWRFRQPGPRITIFPSVVRDTGCQSHFIVQRGAIWWTNDVWEYEDAEIDAGVVIDLCAYNSFISAEEISEKLDVDPWSVFRLCRRLVSRGHLIEGPSPRSGRFARRIPSSS